MSVIKKGIKKIWKGVRTFVKSYWKQILIAAVVVFTAGLATVGVAGFSAASAAAGGGMAGALSAAGSTMVAGVASIGGSLGIGQGANLAAFGGSGYATLGTGAAAQSLGLAGANGAMTAGRIAASAPSAALGGGAPAALAGGAGTTASAAGGVTSVAAPAATAASGGFLSSPAAGPLLQAGMGMLSSYAQARDQDEQWERVKPRGMWGVGLNGEQDANIERTVPEGYMWDPASMQNPNTTNIANNPMQFQQSGLMGNRALDGNRRLNPNVMNPLSPDYDPALARINRGASYG